MNWLKNLKHFGITENDYDVEKDILSNKFRVEASNKDIIWGLFNKLILNNAKDFQSLSMIYHEMAIFLNEHGEDSFHYLQKTSEMRLLGYKQEDFITEVEIVTFGERSCESCRRLQGRKYTINDALKTMPIPNKECSTTLYNEKPGWCNCIYVPIIAPQKPLKTSPQKSLWRRLFG
ncbi:MAG: hypothetical protein ACLQUS_14830 [Desulfobaccales bacterium]